MAKKTYIEKLNDLKDLPKVVELNEKAQKKFSGKTMVVPKPTDIYDIMKNIPQGKLITTSEIRKIISKKYKTDTTCPLTTGIFTNISANASVELNDNMPYWRTLKSKGELNPKFPNAPEEQIALLEKEGFEIIKKGVKNIKYFVKDYDKYLVLDI
jgi:alkylated DNA nucleotide flippase Atl1